MQINTKRSRRGSFLRRSSCKAEPYRLAGLDWVLSVEKERPAFPGQRARLGQVYRMQAAEAHFPLSACNLETEEPAFESRLGHLQPQAAAITVIAGLACLGHRQGGQLVDVERHDGSTLPAFTPALDLDSTGLRRSLLDDDFALFSYEDGRKKALLRGLLFSILAETVSATFPMEEPISSGVPPALTPMIFLLISKKN